MKKTLIALVALAGLANADMVTLGDNVTLVSSITPSVLNGSNSQLTIDTAATGYTEPLSDYILTFQFSAVTSYSGDAFIRMHNNENLCVRGNDDNEIFITLGYQGATPQGGKLAADTTSTFALTVSGTNNVAYLSNLSTGDVVTLSNLNETFTDSTFTNQSAATRFYTNGATQKFILGQVANLTGLDAAQVLSVATTGNYTATPEPATATLSLLALAGLAARRRRH